MEFILVYCQKKIKIKLCCKKKKEKKKAYLAITPNITGHTSKLVP